MVKTKSVIAQVATANILPPMLTLKNPQKSDEQKDEKMKCLDMNSEAKTEVELTKEQLKKLFEKIYLSGIKDWSEEDQKDVEKLIKDFSFLFALNDLDLGKMSCETYHQTYRLYTFQKKDITEYQHISLNKFENIYKKCWR